MRSFSLCCANYVVCTALSSILLTSTGARADAPAKPADQAAQFVQQALQAEVDGKPTDRADLLKQALTLAPDFAPAHWQSGEIRSGDKWASVDNAAKQDSHSAKFDEYRKMRDQSAQTVDDQLQLARWCEKAGLNEQQRTHLMFVLELQPNNKEAISKLGMVRFRGQLVSATQLDEVKSQLKQSVTESKEWKTRVAAWRQQMLEHPDTTKDVLKQIRAVRDPAAIPALENGFAKSGPEVGQAVVDCLAAMPQQAATESLLRFAVFSSRDDVARAAAYALRTRSMYGYVPILISALRSPIEVHDEPEHNRFDRTMATRMSLFQEGPFADTLITANNDTVTRHQMPQVPQVLKQDPLISQRQKNAVANAVEHINENAAECNTILASVLETATGQQLGNNPSAWWDWWFDENEYYSPPEKPIVNARLNLGLRVDCFVAGTPVWTMSGLMQIEKIKVGELVLAQNTETGEIAYKPVLGALTRPTSPVMEIQIGDRIIRCAKGHPFWVSGKGWQMAKELKAGQWLHTASGEVQIDSAEPSDEAVCYNLVVADFHDYFVSNAKVLVHDNLLRGPTLATVPGLAEAK